MSLATLIDRKEEALQIIAAGTDSKATEQQVQFTILYINVHVARTCVHVKHLIRDAWRAALYIAFF